MTWGRCGPLKGSLKEFTQQEKIIFVRIATLSCGLCLKVLPLRRNLVAVELAVEFSALMEMMHGQRTVQICIVSTWNVAPVTELLNFKFCFVLIWRATRGSTAVVRDGTFIAGWHCPNVLMRKKVWSFQGRAGSFSREADLELTSGDLEASLDSLSGSPSIG